MKKLLFLFILFYFQISQAQIHLGQATKETVYFLEFFLRERPEWDVEKNYYNGELQEVIIEKDDLLYYDLDAVVDVVERFVFQEGRYKKHLEQFPELSLDYLEKKFSEHYAEQKFGSYYLSDDFSEYRKISLVDGLATITTGKISEENFTGEELKKFERLHLSYQQDLKDYRKKKEALWNEYVNLDAHHENFVEKSLPTFASAMVDLIKANFDPHHSFKELKGQFRFRVYAEQDSKFTGCEVEVIQSTIDFVPQKLYNLPLTLPLVMETFEGKEYYRNREAFFDLKFNLTRGKVLARKKRNKVEFIDGENLPADQKSFIEGKMKDLERGKYVINFQYGYINDTPAHFIVPNED
ncbi:hypothetical protein [uncultured Salegentibacter sp.]|uniref:hypothetical protein n=1 Tax=uncultured Salegentibacter sp. TaxID=259320 RepID=UPI0030DCA769